jgi:nucleoside-diphosphate-sugar epimerase
MPSVLVTGANGFIGAALCSRMASAGWSVRAAVFPSGAPVPAGASAVPVGGVDGKTDWTAALAGVEVVVHLAARVHVMKETAVDPLEAFRSVNVEGTRRLAQSAAAAGVKRLVFLSTIGVHGASSETPLTEESPLRPHNDYSRSKLEGEAALAEASRGTGLETVIVRAPLVYGPGNKGNMDRLLSALRRGWPLPLASVRNRRSFICVDNLVDALLACAAHPGAGGKVFLVSDGTDLSTPELVRELCAGLGRPARLFPCPPALLRLAWAGLTDSLAVDAGRIRRELGWSPGVPAADGLRAAAASSQGAV